MTDNIENPKSYQSTQRRRRSLFEDDNDSESRRKTLLVSSRKFPEEKSNILYPFKYIENVSTELEQWKMYIKKTLEEKQKFKSEKVELENTLINECILSPEQQDFFDSLKFDEYMRKVEVFCNRMQIYAHKTKYRLDDEYKKYLATQRKIEEQVLRKHLKQVT